MFLSIDGKNVRIERSIEHVTKDMLSNLYVSVGFGEDHHYADLDDMVQRMFGPGVSGLFAFHEDDLIGLVRVFSDGCMVSWVSEICIAPDWQRKGVGTVLLNLVNEQFRHTDLYVQPFAGQEDFVVQAGIPVRPQLTVCGRAGV